MQSRYRVGCLLSEKCKDHLGLRHFNENFAHESYEFCQIQTQESISNQGSFDIILHKVSDYVKQQRNGDKNADRILKEINQSPLNAICIDPPQTVLNLADRAVMFQIIDKCSCHNEKIKVIVPPWILLSNSNDFAQLPNKNLSYPLICKALCAGEGPGGHSMQLIFHESQLDSLKVMPCVAQEFRNHDNIMYKVFVFGPKYFICTRPSVRNFPINGQPLEKTDSICFDSHDVAKLTAVTFLNSYQTGFVLKNSSNDNSEVLDDNIVRQILCRLANQINFTFLGVDILVTDNGSTYNLVDVNYLPSYDGVEDKFNLLIKVLDNFVSQGRPYNYWSV
ncbi:hypothetical protein HZS_7441 [Henneguya salminicola]|nr:hypothetical protein HZS_7441 [Henneguya salminicola]